MSLTAKKLSARDRLFVHEYLIDLDPRRAALDAGYTESMARSKAYQWVSNRKTKPHVFDAVQAAMEKRAKRIEITADRVAQEFAKLGFSDIRRIFGPGGALIDPADLDDDTAAAVQSIEVITRRAPGDEKTVEHVHKIKLADKIGALTQVGRHLGMFTDHTKITGDVNVNINGADADL